MPWNEALNDESFPAEVETAIDEAIANKTPQHKVFLTATATDTDRDKLAKYWNDDGSHQPLPADWAKKSFNSPEIIKAYRNYCHQIIDAVQCEYVQKLIESDRLNAEFVIWFIYRDYDLLESHLPEPSVALKIWRDTGLKEGKRNNRPSHDVWDMWRSFEVE